MVLVTTATGVINRIIFVGLMADPVCYVIQRAMSLFGPYLRKKQPLSVPV